jgi:hypothetical protein
MEHDLQKAKKIEIDTFSFWATFGS